MKNPMPSPEQCKTPTWNKQKSDHDHKIVLGIETSCDDTSMALLKGVPGSSDPQKQVEILSHYSFSQDDVLSTYGGVVPEISARNHVKKLVPVLEKVTAEAGVGLEDVDLVSVTQSPGLLGALLTGINMAKSIALKHHCPLYPANHLHAHLEAIFLTEAVSYPYVGVLLSGGHSLFVLTHSNRHFEVLASTVDDAIGEAFDKGGKLMGLGYPAGRIIDELARTGDPHRFQFPIGLKGKKTANMSFSGVKTALKVFLDQKAQGLDLWKKGDEASVDLKDLAASYQFALTEAIVFKLKRLMNNLKEEKGLERLPIVLGGGVALNGNLRKKLDQHFPKVHLVAPPFCSDNGAMVANLGLRHFDLRLAFPQCLDFDAGSRYIPQNIQQQLAFNPSFKEFGVLGEQKHKS